MTDRSRVLDFEAGRRRFARRQREVQTRTMPSNLLDGLATHIDSAQQAFKAREMIDRGYCGHGLKQAIAEAQALPLHLREAGRIVQQLIARDATKGHTPA